MITVSLTIVHSIIVVFIDHLFLASVTITTNCALTPLSNRRLFIHFHDIHNVFLTFSVHVDRNDTGGARMTKEYSFNLLIIKVFSSFSHYSRCLRLSKIYNLRVLLAILRVVRRSWGRFRDSWFGTTCKVPECWLFISVYYSIWNVDLWTLIEK